MWCTTPPLHNLSIFPNREIPRSFKHTVAFFFYLTEMLKCWRCLWPACVMILTTGAPQILSRCLRQVKLLFCLFTGSVLLCTILFKLQICLFAFCFVFSFVYCSIAFPFLLFSGFNTGCALQLEGLCIRGTCRMIDVVIIIDVFVCLCFVFPFSATSTKTSEVTRWCNLA